MKMRALALAVGLVSGLPVAALAAPTIYGQFKVSLDKASDYPIGGAQGLLDGSAALADAWGVESYSSNIGIRGSETLYNKDMSVIYQFEAGADVDGDAATPFSKRNAFLGLDTKAGKIFAGNYDSVTKLADGDIDQFDKTAADMSSTFVGQHRNSNSLNWESKDFSGMTFRVQVAPGEATAVGGDVKDGLTDTLGASVTFKQDALFAALAFETSYDATVVTPSDRQLIRGSIGTSLDGGLELGAIVEMFEYDPDLAGADSVDGTSLLVSGKIATSDRFAIKAQLGMLDSSDLEAEVTTITAGADYMLGKTTKVYGLVSMSDAEIDAASPLAAAGTDESGNLISFGMEHKF